MVLTSYSFFPPFNFILYQFLLSVLQICWQTNQPPRNQYSCISTFDHMHCGSFFHIQQSTLSQSVIASHIVYSLQIEVQYDKYNKLCVLHLSGPSPACMCLLSVILRRRNCISCLCNSIGVSFILSNGGGVRILPASVSWQCATPRAASKT